jgi:superfamily I DNA/RNA helicase
MQVTFSRDFKRQHTLLRTRGGEAQNAALQVDQILGRIAATDEPQRMDSFGNLTHHGESRIEHCFKYDLIGRYRLVCIKTDSMIHLAFVGTHADTDRWLENNRGHKYVVTKNTRRAVQIREVDFDGVAERGSLPEQQARPVPNIDGSIPALFPHVILAALIDSGFNDTELGEIRRCTQISDDNEIIDAANAPSDEARKSVLISVAIELRDNNLNAAQEIIDRYKHGVSDDIASVASERETSEILEANPDVFFQLRDLHPDEMAKALGGNDFHDWLLFLHPDQKPVVQLAAKRVLSLRGVPGSGKTCVLVHRARELARRYPQDRIAVVALNPALAGLLKKLVGMLCTEEIAARIDVLSMDSLCQIIIKHFEPNRQIQLHDPRNDESLEDCWTEVWSRESTQSEMQPIVRSLEQRGVDAARYVRDELIWVRSAFAKSAAPDRGSILLCRDVYENPEATERRGRKIPFSRDWRSRILKLLAEYEEYCETGALYDPAAVTLLAHRWVGALRSSPPPDLKFRSLLVDEVQDLGTVELEILNNLAPLLDDAMLLVGDPEQQVFPKAHDLSKADIQPNQRRLFRRNFRNPKQILEAAEALAKELGDDGEGGDRLLPEFASRESDPPLAASMKNPEDEVLQVAQFLKQRHGIEQVSVSCIVACGLRDDDEKSLHDLAAAYRAAGLDNVRLLRADSGLDGGTVYVSSLETIKGFEFSTVVVTRCADGLMPVASLPAEESWRDARRLYVAFTRARDSLVLTWSGQRSRFLTGIAATLREAPLIEVDSPVDADPAGIATTAAAPPMGGTANRPAETRPLESEKTRATDADAAGKPVLPNESAPPASQPSVEPARKKPTTDLPAPQANSAVREGSVAPAAEVSIERVLRENGFKIIDKRPQGGALWVLGGEEIGVKLGRVVRGYAIKFAPNGSRSTERRPAWWLRRNF